MDTISLRQKLLDLAIRGKLTEQETGTEAASVLLERIHLKRMESRRAQRRETENEGEGMMGNISGEIYIITSYKV